MEIIAIILVALVACYFIVWLILTITTYNIIGYDVKREDSLFVVVVISKNIFGSLKYEPVGNSIILENDETSQAPLYYRTEAEAVAEAIKRNELGAYSFFENKHNGINKK